MSQLNLFGGVDPDPLTYEMRCNDLRNKWPHGHHFTADDITAKLGLPPGDHNQLGSIIRGWHDRGLIEQTDQTAVSMRADRHGGIQRIWRKR